MVYDMDNPCMNIGTMYPSMENFRLVVRQFSISKEFELGIEKSNRTRFRGYCTGEGCPWHIVAHRQDDMKTIWYSFLILMFASSFK